MREELPILRKKALGGVQKGGVSGAVTGKILVVNKQRKRQVENNAVYNRTSTKLRIKVLFELDVALYQDKLFMYICMFILVRL